MFYLLIPSKQLNQFYEATLFNKIQYARIEFRVVSSVCKTKTEFRVNFVAALDFFVLKLIIYCEIKNHLLERFHRENQILELLSTSEKVVFMKTSTFFLEPRSFLVFHQFQTLFIFVFYLLT